jgi:hypothetical protein
MVYYYSFVIGCVAWYRWYCTKDRCRVWQKMEDRDPELVLSLYTKLLRRTGRVWFDRSEAAARIDGGFWSIVDIPEARRIFMQNNPIH